MAIPFQFAVLQKKFGALSPEHLKRAFSAFVNLTEIDAVRLAGSARGILLRQLNRDGARALQTALEAEGVGVVIVREDELPRLPDGKSLHRVEMVPEAFIVYDLLGRPNAIDWSRIALVAAGAVGRFGFTKVQTENTDLRFNVMSGVWPKKTTEIGHKTEWDTTLILEVVLADGAGRYQIEAAEFPFKYVIDRPELSAPEKFVWLVREICRHATNAILNDGARAIYDGEESVLQYNSRQMLADEMVWLLWNHSEQARTGEK